VKNYFANAWTEIKAGFDGGIGGIITTLVNFSPLGLVYQAFAGVMSYLGIELPGRFTEFGGMIVNGLINGLTAGIGAVKDAIGSIGDDQHWLVQGKTRHPQPVAGICGAGRVHYGRAYSGS